MYPRDPLQSDTVGLPPTVLNSATTAGAYWAGMGTLVMEW